MVSSISMVCLLPVPGIDSTRILVTSNCSLYTGIPVEMQRLSQVSVSVKSRQGINKEMSSQGKVLIRK